MLFTGNLEGDFLVLDARNGKPVYRFNTGGPLAGGVVTWQQQGRQPDDRRVLVLVALPRTIP